MTYPQAFLDWEEATREQGREQGERSQAQSLVLRLLRRRLGNVSTLLQTQIERLSLSQLESLSEDLLEFNRVEDLQPFVHLPL